MNARLLLAAGAALILTACATPTTTPPPATSAPRAAVAEEPAAPPTASAGTAAFRTADFAWSTAKGSGGIDGQLTYKNGANAYSCVDAGVVLTPETPWVKRRMEILYNSDARAALPADEVRGRTPPERSQDYSAFVKRATCDTAGRFTLSGLADGPWYLITVARPAPGASGPEMAIMRRVVVSGGKIVKVSL